MMLEYTQPLSCKHWMLVRLMLCAEEMRLRFPDAWIWLSGSALYEAEPEDWDVRIVLPNCMFDKHNSIYWNTEAVVLTQMQRKSNHLNFDIRIYPARVWYIGEALCLTQYKSAAAPERQVVERQATEQELERNLRVIEAQKNNPEFHILIGSLMFLRGDQDTALQAFIRAVQINEKCAQGWLNIGNVKYEKKLYREAAVYYYRALTLKPDYGKAYCNLANTFSHLNAHAQAMTFYEAAIRCEPGIAAYYHNKGSCLTALQRYREADAALCKALELDVDEKILNTMGNLCAAEENLHGAAAAYRVAIKVAPKYAPLYTNLANIYSSLRMTAEARLSYERGLVLEPNNPGCRYNLALDHLREGNYRTGWHLYESRFEFHELKTKQRQFDPPRWHGEPIAGKRILIHAEQGMGDTFQFARFVPELYKQTGAHIVFEVHHGLQRLAASVYGVREVYGRGAPLPRFDMHCPLLSLPFMFGTTLANLPSPRRYMNAPEADVEQMQRMWPRMGFRIGIAWAGNPKYKADKVRSFSLREFAALADAPVTMFSLQKGPMVSQIEKYKDVMSVVDASSQHRDFAESAALMETMDLIITSDTSVAHLAGAMGKEVWVLLAHLPDWRWMNTGDSYPWYPAMRLFRQESPGDWAEVFARVRVALTQRMFAIT